FAALLLVLLETPGTWVAIACGCMFLLWANLHGGWAFGLVLLACYVAGDALEMLGNNDRATWGIRLTRDGLALGFSALATFCTPYGFRLHQAVLATLSDRSVATLINEYQPPGLSALPDILFFTVLGLSILAILGSRRRPSSPALLVIVVTTAFAFRASRNIALFGLVAWPLISIHLLGHRSAVAAGSDSKPGRRIGAVAAAF